MRPISEDTVRHIANIVGPSSAAADALRDAESRRSRGETVEFFQHKATLIVKGTPAAGAQRAPKGEK